VTSCSGLGAGVCRSVAWAGMNCRLALDGVAGNGRFLPTDCGGWDPVQPGVVVGDGAAYSGCGCWFQRCNGSVAGMSLREFFIFEFGLFRRRAVYATGAS
jgi:hypothetical protein